MPLAPRLVPFCKHKLYAFKQILCADSCDLGTFCETTLNGKKPANPSQNQTCKLGFFSFSAEQVAEPNVHHEGNLPGKLVLSEANPERLKW